jgi:hypothetical protein
VAESVLELARALRTALVSFLPYECSGEDCAALVEELAALEKVSAAARVRAAARAGSCGVPRERGFADVSDWMARATGSTAGAAKAALETAAALEAQPDAKAALDSGEISFAQARELVKTEAAVPGSAADLLDVAKGQSLRALKDEARDRRLRAVDPEELHALQHAAKHARHWTNKLGNTVCAVELPPEHGVPFVNRLDAETDRLWLKTPDVPRSMLAAEAFVRMVSENGGVKGKANRSDLVIVCDLRAYRRGHAHEDEPCHIVGSGPIPVSLAKELGKDAFLKAVLHTGTEIHTIAHSGRRSRAVLRTALNLGTPPEFNGNICAAGGCDRRYHLQDDHIDPVANGGETRYTNSQPLCPSHHRMKTASDRKAGLLSRKPPAEEELQAAADLAVGGVGTPLVFPEPAGLFAAWPAADLARAGPGP